MNEHSMYFQPDEQPTTDSQEAVNRLHQILNLAKVGAASTFSELDPPHMIAAHCGLNEVIYQLGSEAIHFVEMAEKKIAKSSATS